MPCPRVALVPIRRLRRSITDRDADHKTFSTQNIVTSDITLLTLIPEAHSILKSPPSSSRPKSRRYTINLVGIFRQRPSADKEQIYPIGPIKPISRVSEESDGAQPSFEDMEELRTRCLDMQAELAESQQRCHELEELCRDFQITHLAQFLENQNRGWECINH